MPATRRRPFQSRLVHRLSAAVGELTEAAHQMERGLADEIAAAHPEHRASARNLSHYMALRQHDLRHLQTELTACGLSSLGRCEPHTLASLAAVQRALEAMDGKRRVGRPARPPVDFRSGPLTLERHTSALLGAPRAGRSVRIMVTMPSEAAQDPRLILALVRAGMDVMRINCAHDDAAAWRAMVRHRG